MILTAVRRSTRRILTIGGAVGLTLALSGCLEAPHDVSVTRATAPATALPPMKVFQTQPPTAPTRSNSDMARDFLDLSFQLESGRPLPVLTRYEEPVRISLAGDLPPGMVRDLDAVISRIRREAGIDIARVSAGGSANLAIEAVSSSDIRKQLPHAACFVVPGITSLKEYRAARRQEKTDWAKLDQRRKLAIFIPNDAAPQETRDCLHEELAQALGPLNDLYRLPDSVYNDDNMHTVLTGFDMLMLRVTYAPELHSGMTRAQVAARVPAILSRMNPAGNAIASRPVEETSRDWIEAIGAALGGSSSLEGRERAAARAVSIARTRGWNDHRTAFAEYILARIMQSRDPERALKHLEAARALYAQRPETRIHETYVLCQLAAHAISQGDGARALALLEGQTALAQRAENAALLASIKMLQAEALELEGRDTEARATRLDSLGWARYGFGPDWAVEAKLQEVAALNPLNSGG